MSKIRILPEGVINQIAAGEVVERPASAVKELLENSLDARADAVTVIVKGNGLSLIRVEDDGEGMERDDALLAFERHSTSKLKVFSDLEGIATLGFRGEALPSIASVSDLTLTTRAGGSLAATRVHISGGTIRDVTEVGAPVGTTIEVRRLFFNTPARRKFLKSPKTEMGHIVQAVASLALSHPPVSFRLIREGETILDAPPARNLRERIEEIWGREFAGKLIPVDKQEEGISVTGFICPPELCATHRRGLAIFVNSRSIMSRMIVSAAAEGYGPLLPARIYPVGVIDLVLDPGWVDVNFHPAKREVRFGDPAPVRRLTAEAVREALEKAQPGTAFFPPRPPAPPPSVREETAPSVPADRLPVAIHPVQGELASSGFPAFRIVGQARGTYIAAETPQGLLLIDQHAAHERILYEEFTEALGGGRIEVQPLLAPLQLDLGPREAALLEEKMAILKSLGVEVEPFGGTSFIVTALPALLAGKDKAGLVLEVLGDIEDWEKEPGDPREKLVIRLACTWAVKAKARLEERNLPVLVERLFRCRTPSVCPHGRPTVLSFEWEEIERRFGRR
ncbi:MAG: DNA mismatch repair endonuclease MutL [Candidatus Aureabacteria bacterium]|nr:DNA mismatch repair endonuclease MutL [Candidatus Auribacterota bacterium]